jgi:hypothetical protein
MIDPVTASLLIKLADIAIIGVTTWQSAREAKDDLQPGLLELRALKQRIEDGDVTPTEADRMADIVLEELMAPLDEAVARL